MADACPICLDDITTETPVFMTSCNHTYHTGCFRDLVCQTGHSFADCPMCRTQNTRPVYDSTDVDDATDFLGQWFTIPHRNCCHSTKKGTRCQKKAVFLNNGSCRTHQPNVLPPDRYPLFAEYVNKVLGNVLKWATKVYLIDLIKQLLIRYPEIKTFGDIEHRLNAYYHKRHKEGGLSSLYDGTRMTINPHTIYDHYDVPYPLNKWIKESVQKKRLV